MVKPNLSLSDRLEKALEARKKGFNCAQSLLMAFPDVTGLPESSCARIGMALGAGCGCGETCGVFSATAILVGMNTEGKADEKTSTYDIMHRLKSNFIQSHGYLRCSDIKECPNRKSCNEIIFMGVETLHNHFSEEK